MVLLSSSCRYPRTCKYLCDLEDFGVWEPMFDASIQPKKVANLFKYLPVLRHSFPCARSDAGALKKYA
jgi:hypothetical protein